MVFAACEAELNQHVKCVPKYSSSNYSLDFLKHEILWNVVIGKQLEAAGEVAALFASFDPR